MGIDWLASNYVDTKVLFFERITKSIEINLIQ